MNILKMVGGIIIVTAMIVSLFNFPQVALALAALWVIIGILAFFAITGRRNLKRWNTADTFMSLFFTILGPIGFLVIKSKNPRR